MKELLGGCLITVGLLIAGATGLCTLMFIRIDSWAHFIDAINSAGVPFFFGIGLIAGGITIIVSGRRRRF